MTGWLAWVAIVAAVMVAAVLVWALVAGGTRAPTPAPPALFRGHGPVMRPGSTDVAGCRCGWDVPGAFDERACTDAWLDHLISARTERTT